MISWRIAAFLFGLSAGPVLGFMIPTFLIFLERPEMASGSASICMARSKISECSLIFDTTKTEVYNMLLRTFLLFLFSCLFCFEQPAMQATKGLQEHLGLLTRCS